jgi:tRNA(adenine34) deaminase
MAGLSAGEVEAFLREAIELAGEADVEGNLPIGAVIALDGQIIARGRNAIWRPRLALTRHAETEALHAVPLGLWPEAARMTLVTTLEPCLMCAGAILLHGVGSVVYGAADPYGGALTTFGSLPPFFHERFRRMQWIGPAEPEHCGRLYRLVGEREAQRERRASRTAPGSPP